MLCLRQDASLKVHLTVPLSKDGSDASRHTSDKVFNNGKISPYGKNPSKGKPMKILPLLICLPMAIATPLHADNAMAWNDATHMAVAKAAGLGDYAYLAVGADIAKEKAGEIETGNHFNNTPKGTVVTPEMVLSQFTDYNRPGDVDGHLYGAILAAIDDYTAKVSDSKYALYPFGYAMHYIGDLSMPFHNIAYESFNKSNHSVNDGAVEITGPKNEPTDAKVARLAAEIQRRMSRVPPFHLATDDRNFYRNVAIHISDIANKSSALGYAMADASPQRTLLTEEEAYTQLALSAQLLKATSEAILRKPLR